MIYLKIFCFFLNCDQVRFRYIITQWNMLWVLFLLRLTLVPDLLPFISVLLQNRNSVWTQSLERVLRGEQDAINDAGDDVAAEGCSQERGGSETSRDDRKVLKVNRLILISACRLGDRTTVRHKHRKGSGKQEEPGHNGRNATE
ncbi:hypothetical protein ATANTOWER_005738 [Ataeniobius toweri]|uniref:Uncharacterized protein n=1 Tax=Ataeniobius toweri TaxID=208326 RepID=A0ABU7BH76_9TELE|nr:hypothetical protein [Ataeniobius toweri]